MEITSVGGARTGAMETRGPWMLDHNFDPHFSVNNMYKDLTSAMKLADEVGATLPATSMSVEMLRAAKSQGTWSEGFVYHLVGTGKKWPASKTDPPGYQPSTKA